MTHRQTINDIEVAWAEAGDPNGTAVVFIHGLAESRHSWAVQQGALSDHHTFAYDVRGHGDTTVGDGAGTAQQLSDDLVGFLEHVTGPAICVGYSMGGTIVLGAAAARPDLVTRAIVLGTSSVVGRGAAAFFDGRIALLEAGATDEFAAGLRDDTALAIANPDVDVDAVTATRLAAVGDGRGYINAARAMGGINLHPLTDMLAEITTRVDVVGGELDTFCPRKAADLLMEGLPNATYSEIAGVGHLMNVDNPEEVTRLLTSLLKENHA
jgi:pimeloyl-ACP methyl ester carboxylesterase